MAGKRFLLIRLSSIGDVLHSTPVAQALKQAMPSAHITWVVGENPAGMLQSNPWLDEVYVWPREKWEAYMRQGRLGEAWKLWDQLRRDLRSRNFDVALDIHGLFLSGMVALASGAPRRIGLPNTRELNNWFMTETAQPHRGDKHVIQRYASILRPLGITTTDPTMTLVIDQESELFAKGFLQSQGFVAGQRLIAIVPATTWPSKNWPPDYFATVANYLGQSAVVLLCGSPGDRRIADEVLKQTRVPVIDAVGQTSLIQLAALLAQSTAVITGDTGPLHMAIALGIPSVSIFGPSSPEKFGPLMGPHTALTAASSCLSCFKHQCRQTEHCMATVSPRDVLQAVKNLLSLIVSERSHTKKYGNADKSLFRR